MINGYYISNNITSLCTMNNLRGVVIISEAVRALELTLT